MKGIKKKVETERHGGMCEQLDIGVKKWKREYRM
jgi:hypothetical protein